MGRANDAVSFIGTALNHSLGQGMHMARSESMLVSSASMME